MTNKNNPALPCVSPREIYSGLTGQERQFMKKIFLFIFSVALLNACGGNHGAPACELPETPDRWLAIGQSNMALPPAYEWDESFANVYVKQSAFNEPAIEIDTFTSLPEIKTTFAETPALFAKDLSDLISQDIYIYGKAIGGSPLECWENNNDINGGGDCWRTQIEPYLDDYQSMKGVIWWQGESDAARGALAPLETYAARLQTFFNDLRTALNDQALPIIVVGLEKYCGSDFEDNGGPCVEEPVEWEAVREAQREVAANDNHVYLVETYDFTSGNHHPQSDYAEISSLMAETAHTFLYNSCK